MEAHKEELIEVAGGVIGPRERRIIAKASVIGISFRQIPEPQAFERDRCSVEIRATHRALVDDFGVRRVTTYRLSGFEGRIRPGYRQETKPNEYGREYVRSADNIFDPAGGYWVIGAAQYHFVALIRLLPSRSAIRFEVALDHLTTNTLAGNGLHHDQLQMIAEIPGKRQVGVFDVESEIGSPHLHRFGSDEPSQRAAVVQKVAEAEVGG